MAAQAGDQRRIAPAPTFTDRQRLTLARLEAFPTWALEEAIARRRFKTHDAVIRLPGLLVDPVNARVEFRGVRYTVTGRPMERLAFAPDLCRPSLVCVLLIGASVASASGLRLGDTVRKTPAEQLWPSVDADGDCWEWTGYTKNDGYGRLFVGGKSALAHRLAYTLLVGPIPAGLQIDHLCRNRRCVNPAHLQPVSQLVNNRRGAGWSGRNAKKSRCIHGHPFTPENTILRPTRSGFERVCRECVQRHRRTWRAKLRLRREKESRL